MKSKLILRCFILLGLVLLLSSCVDFTILNISELSARVLIQTPDGGNYTKIVGSGDSTSSFSDHGGSYTISTMPNEDYLSLLRSLREQVSERLFNERESLSAEDIQRLVTNLADIEQQLEKEAARGASCSGAAPDFSSVSAVISWDNTAQDFIVSCSVTATEE